MDRIPDDILLTTGFMFYCSKSLWQLSFIFIPAMVSYREITVKNQALNDRSMNVRFGFQYIDHLVQ